MRVLIVSDRYPPHSLGGYETAAAGVARALRALGHEVRVLTSVFSAADDRAPDDAWRELHRPMDSPSLLQHALWQLADLGLTRRRVREYSPDAIYAFNLVQLFPAVHRQLVELAPVFAYNLQDVWIPTHVRMANEQRGVWLAPGGGGRGWLRRQTARVAQSLEPNWGAAPDVAGADRCRLIFCSRYQLRRHQAAALPLGDHEVIFNPVTLDVPRASPPPPGAPFRLLFVGRLVAEKGALEAVEATRLLARSGLDLRLTIAGPRVYPVAYADDLQARADTPDLRGRVDFLGNVPNERVFDLLAAHHALVFPSTHLEGMPMTLLEAMAAELPVVATPSGGTVELLLPEQNGLELPLPPTAEDVARQVERLARNPELWRQLSVEGRRFVEAHCTPIDVGRRTVAALSAEA